MANEVDSTELDVVIPEVWQKEVGRGRYSAAIADQVAHVEIENIEAFGDIFHLSYFPRISVNNVTATTGAVTNQAVTLLEGQLTVNNWKEATVEVVDRAGGQSIFGDSRKAAQSFAEEFGPALAENSDNTLLALQSSITTNNAGSTTDPVDMNDGLARAAMQKLDESRIPKKQRSFVLSPKAFWDIFGQDKYAAAYATGASKGVQVAGPEIVPTLYGAKWFESAEVAVSGQIDKNLLLHKKCLAMGMQRNVQIVFFAKIALSVRVCGHALYGVQAIREDHGCVINTKT